MKYIGLKKFQSIAESISERDMPDDLLLSASNVILDNGKIKRRSGIKEFISDLGGPVLGIHTFKSLGEWTLVFVTDKNIFKYYEPTKSVININPRYSDGTVSVVDGDATVTGVNTRFDDGILSGWLGGLYIGFGPNYDAITSWYEVDSIVNNTSLELVEPWDISNGSYSGSEFFIKYELSGDKNYPVIFADGFSASRGRDIMVFTNQRDEMIFFDISVGYCEILGLYENQATYSIGATTMTMGGSFPDRDVFELATLLGSDFAADTYIIDYNISTNVATLNKAITGNTYSGKPLYMEIRPGSARHILYAGSASSERLMAANITEVNANDSLEKRVIFSEVGECLHFKGGYYDINNSSEEISGMVAAKSRIYIYKKSSIIEMIPDERGTVNDPFNIIPNRRIDTGTSATRTIKDFGDYIVYAGENGVSLFDGVSIKSADQNIRDKMVSSVRLDNFSKMFSLHMKETSLLLFAIPQMRSSSNLFYVFNTRTGGWFKWTFPWYFYCAEKFRKTSYTLWSDFESGFDLAAVIASGNVTVTNVNTDDLYAGMLVTGANIRPDTFIDSVGSASIVLTKAPTYSGNAILNFKHTWNSAHGIWSDYAVVSETYSYLLGSEDGIVYEYNDVFNDDNGFPIESEVKTKDYYINDPINTIKLLEILLVFKPFNGYSINIEVSTDFGETWGAIDSVSLDGLTELVDKRIGMYKRGNAIRLRITNSGSPFEIDGIYLGYNDSGERV